MPQAPANPNYRSAYAFAALGVIWGSNFIFMKWAVGVIAPVQVAFLRVLFGFVPLFVFSLIRRALHKRDLRHWRHILVMAVLAPVVYYYAFVKGTALLTSSVAGMLSGTIPLFTFLLTALFLKQEHVTLRKAIGVALGFLGVLLIARPWSIGVNQVNLGGVAYMIAGSLSLGGSFVYAKRFMSTLDISPLALSTYQIGTALCVLALITPYAGLQNIGSDRVALLGLVLGLGLSGTGIAYVLYYYIIQQMGAVRASTVTYLPPLVALVIGCALAKEPFRALDILAMIIILCGVYVIQLPKRSLKLKPSHGP
jgi:drug/metabolite transporter (DMT)-like permease